MAVRKVDVFFVENGGPLERRGVLCLTCCAMTQFTIQRLLSAQLILHASAMAVCFVAHVETFEALEGSVWRAFLPFVLALGAFAFRLAFVHFFVSDLVVAEGPGSCKLSRRRKNTERRSWEKFRAS